MPCSETGFKPPLKGLALAALEWLKKQRSAGFGRGFAVGLASRRNNCYGGRTGLSRRCRHYFYCAQTGARFRPNNRQWDQTIVVAPIGSPEEAIVSTLGLDWAGSAVEMAQAPRGWWAGRWASPGASGHGLFGGDARRSWPGDGGGSRSSAGAGGGHCAGTDDVFR